VDIIVFDTETTGLLKNRLSPLDKQPQIIELYAMRLDKDRKKIDEIDVLVNPKKKLDDIITKITGLTDDDLRDASDWAGVHDQVHKFFSAAPARVFGHNLYFDLEMLNLEYRRMGCEDLVPAEKVCTVEATEYIKGYRLSLSALHEYLFGEAFEGAHRAKIDVEATARCVIEMEGRGIC